MGEQHRVSFRTLEDLKRRLQNIQLSPTKETSPQSQHHTTTASTTANTTTEAAAATTPARESVRQLLAQSYQEALTETRHEWGSPGDAEENGSGDAMHKSNRAEQSGSGTSRDVTTHSHQPGLQIPTPSAASLGVSPLRQSLQELQRMHAERQSRFKELQAQHQTQITDATTSLLKSARQHPLHQAETDTKAAPNSNSNNNNNSSSNNNHNVPSTPFLGESGYADTTTSNLSNTPAQPTVASLLQKVWCGVGRFFNR